MCITHPQSVSQRFVRSDQYFLFPLSDRRKPDLDVIRVGWALSALGAEGDLTREVQITHILSEGELQVQGSAGFQGTSAGHAQAFWSKSLSVTGDCFVPHR